MKFFILVKELPEKSEKISQLTFATNKHNVPKSNVSETKPVETFPKPPTKPKRRTIKDYQREKFNQTVSNVESQPVHHEVSHLSKARQRKQDEQRKVCHLFICRNTLNMGRKLLKKENLAVVNRKIGRFGNINPAVIISSVSKAVQTCVLFAQLCTANPNDVS